MTSVSRRNWLLGGKLYLERLGPDKGVFVRVGSVTNRGAHAVQVEQMRRYAQVESYDEQPMLDLDSAAIDFRSLPSSSLQFERSRLGRSEHSNNEASGPRGAA